MAKSIEFNEKKWQRESDARTLSEAEQIKADKGRLKGATQAAKQMAQEAIKQAEAMKRIASKTPPPKSSPKASVRSNTNTGIKKR